MLSLIEIWPGVPEKKNFQKLSIYIHVVTITISIWQRAWFFFHLIDLHFPPLKMLYWFLRRQFRFHQCIFTILLASRSQKVVALHSNNIELLSSNDAFCQDQIGCEEKFVMWINYYNDVNVHCHLNNRMSIRNIHLRIRLKSSVIYISWIKSNTGWFNILIHSVMRMFRIFSIDVSINIWYVMRMLENVRRLLSEQIVFSKNTWNQRICDKNFVMKFK